MENHDSPEAVAKRASQEDPIVMYLIVREEINMSPGKLGAQTGHAVGMQMLQYFKCAINIQIDGYNDQSILTSAQYDLFCDWLNSSYRKVTLTADEKEWAKLKEFYKNPEAVIVVDAGLTELEPGTETVMALIPMKKSARPKLVKRLQALK
jgi:peptidyl-tRNA hydrolase, PTH2 family